MVWQVLASGKTPDARKPAVRLLIHEANLHPFQPPSAGAESAHGKSMHHCLLRDQVRVPNTRVKAETPSQSSKTWFVAATKLSSLSCLVGGG